MPPRRRISYGFFSRPTRVFPLNDGEIAVCAEDLEEAEAAVAERPLPLLPPAKTGGGRKAVGRDPPRGPPSRVVGGLRIVRTSSKPM